MSKPSAPQASDRLGEDRGESARSQMGDVPRHAPGEALERLAGIFGAPPNFSPSLSGETVALDFSDRAAAEAAFDAVTDLPWTLASIAEHVAQIERELDAAQADIGHEREWVRTHGATHAENILLRGQLREAREALAKCVKGDAGGSAETARQSQSPMPKQRGNASILTEP